MTDYICEICGKQEADNFRFEYGIQFSYDRTQVGTKAEGVFSTPYNVYQSKTPYKSFGDDTVHLCLTCIKKRVKIYKIINFVPIGVGLLLFLLFAGMSYQEILDGEIYVLIGILAFVIPIYFITRHFLIRHYSKIMNIDRKEIKQAIKTGIESLNKRWKDKSEVVCFYQYKKIKPLESIFKESGQLKVQEYGIEKDKELIVIPAFVFDDTKDPDFKKIYKI